MLHRHGYGLHFRPRRDPPIEVGVERAHAIAFRVADMPLGQALLASRGKRIHAAGRLRAEEWQGQKRVQLQLEDAAPAGA